MQTGSHSSLIHSLGNFWANFESSQIVSLLKERVIFLLHEARVVAEAVGAGREDLIFALDLALMLGDDVGFQGGFVGVEALAVFALKDHVQTAVAGALSGHAVCLHLVLVAVAIVHMRVQQGSLQKQLFANQTLEEGYAVITCVSGENENGQIFNEVHQRNCFLHTCSMFLN